MKERPVLFTAPMVRALLDGRKTQTRRIVKPCPQQKDADEPRYRGEDSSRVWWPCRTIEMMVDLRDMPNHCPHGDVGERLWVKETFFPAHLHRNHPKFAAVTPRFLYAADYEREPARIVRPLHWKPSIFCTREASRITLEIKSVRVERLQDISEADAEAEGVERNEGFAPWTREDGWIKYPYNETTCEDFPAFTAKESYQSLWEMINGAGSWAKNPWVWVIEFRRVEA